MMLPSSRCIDLRELFEDKIVVFRRDSESGVSDYGHQLAVVRLGAHPHASARWREVDRLAEKIAEHVRHLLTIGEERRQVWRQVQVQSEALPGQQRLVQSRHLLHDLSERE